MKALEEIANLKAEDIDEFLAEGEDALDEARSEIAEGDFLKAFSAIPFSEAQRARFLKVCNGVIDVLGAVMVAACGEMAQNAEFEPDAEEVSPLASTEPPPSTEDTSGAQESVAKRMRRRR